MKWIIQAEDTTPERRNRMFAQSEIFGLTMQNSGMYVMIKGSNVDLAVHRDTDNYIWAYGHL